MLADKTLGKKAFEIYTKEIGPKEHGGKLLRWEDIHPRHQGAWQMAAEGVFLALRQDPETAPLIEVGHWLIRNLKTREWIGCTSDPTFKYEGIPGVMFDLVDPDNCPVCRRVARKID